MYKVKFAFLVLLLYAGQPQAQITSIVGPTGSGDFGYSVTVLSNGNYVITDPYFNNGSITGAGAVYLYDGITHTLISTLKGSGNSDFVGIDGVIALPNGNFVVLSRSVDNGPIVDCGAITWVNGVTGLSGVVTPANSLFGTATDDSLGWIDNYGQILGGVVVFDNSSYAVLSPAWDNGSIVNAGAVTLLNGNSPTTGFISSGNSLVGSSPDDRVGSDGIFILDNNHFIVGSFHWDNGTIVDAGAITWCNGISLTGQLSSANSLVGTATGDFYDSNNVASQIPIDLRITKLANGNFVILTAYWDNLVAGISNAGAVTWGSNTLGLSGVISRDNSLTGSMDYEQEIASVVALTNGNYVVVTPIWHSGTGAVTWGNGTTGVTGIIDTTNSLVGSSEYTDQVGDGGVVALSNGNYVVNSPHWTREDGPYVGAVTWGNGTTGTTGKVTPANSLTGTTSLDFERCTVTPLSNGNYVVSTPRWDYGNTVDAGAITWGNGNTGITGEITSSRSLIEIFTNPDFGFQVTPLPNGNYVVCNPFWDNGPINEAGAVTWANGTTGIAGFVDSTNSLVGSHGSDWVGVGVGLGYSYVTVLNNGNYVISSPNWKNYLNNGVAQDAGAATWANGMTGITGPVNSNNSLVGTTTGDRVSFGVKALTNGNYVVESRLENIAASQSFGAVTWGNGNSGVTGFVTSSNSLVGGPGLDVVGGVQPLDNGNYLVGSHIFSGGPGTGKGSITWGNGMTGTAGIVSSDNSLVGSSPGDDVGEQVWSSNDHYVIQSSRYDNGNITDAGAVTLASAASGIAGVITSCNSIVGQIPNNGWNLKFAYSDLYGYLICGEAAHNVVYVLQLSPAAVAPSVSIVANPGNTICPGTNVTFTATPTNAGSTPGYQWKLNGSNVGTNGNTYGSDSLTTGATVTCVITSSLACANPPTGTSNEIVMTVTGAVAAANDSTSVQINGNGPVPLITSGSCHLIATLEARGANPIQGLVKAKVWSETTVPEDNGKPFVSRHYEITPLLNALNGTARITLYFTQQEFDDFNAHAGSTSDLPVDSGDTPGIAKLRIIKYPGVSDDYTGLPGSYSGTPVMIDPIDQEVVWSSSDSRWEVSFDVTGFSGFIVQTNVPALPLTLLEFKGRVVDREALLSWKTSDEVNTSSFDIERSTDGRSFAAVGNIAAISQPGINAYSFTDVNVGSLGIPVVYYRLKLIDIDGRFTYSNIITLVMDNKINVVFYPNPVMNNATLTITVNQPAYLQARIIDNVGSVVRQQQWNVGPGNTSLPVDLSKLSKGMYYLELKGEKVNERIQFVKL